VKQETKIRNFEKTVFRNFASTDPSPFRDRINFEEALLPLPINNNSNDNTTSEEREPFFGDLPKIKSNQSINQSIKTETNSEDEIESNPTKSGNQKGQKVETNLQREESTKEIAINNHKFSLKSDRNRRT